MDEAMVGIPAYNEENTIASVVMKVKDHVDKVVVVDDGSTDDTSRLAEKAGAKVVQHENNKGYGASLRTIFQYARQKDVSSLVIIDGDGQHPEHEVTDLLSKVLDEEVDIAIGSRFLDEEHKKQVPAYRRLGIKILTWLTPSGKAKNGHNGEMINVTDGQSGFRAYSKKAIQKIRPKESGMGASAEILMLARKNNLDILEVPISISYDGDTSSEGPVKHAMGVIGSIIRYIETKHALLTFGLTGLIVFIIGILLGIRAMTVYTDSGVFPLGTTILAVLFLVGGMGSGITGLILHAIMNAHRRGYE